MLIDECFPMKHPKLRNPGKKYFIKLMNELLEPMVVLSMQGQPRDIDRAKELAIQLDEIMAIASEKLQYNPIIKEFMQFKHKEAIEQAKTKLKSKLKQDTDYYKPYNFKDTTIRSFIVNEYVKENTVDVIPDNKLPSGHTKWNITDLKRNGITEEMLKPYIEIGLLELAKYKTSIANDKIYDKLKTLEVDMPEFNPKSAQQKKELFQWLEIPSTEQSLTSGEDSWSRMALKQLLSSL
jgi:hypothetical protein